MMKLQGTGGADIPIKICAEYRNMVPKAKVGLSGTWPEAAGRRQGVTDKPAEA